MGTIKELNVALAIGAKVIGVNNRNLHTFSLDMNTTNKIVQEMKTKKQNVENYALCALSGISSAEDVHRYRLLGIEMVLIGESLMRSSDPTEAIKNLCLDPNDYDKLKPLKCHT